MLQFTFLCYIFTVLLLFPLGCGKCKYGGPGYCLPCPIGTYNPHDSASSCTSCPSGWTTHGTGRREYWECRLGEKPQISFVRSPLL